MAIYTAAGWTKRIFSTCLSTSAPERMKYIFIRLYILPITHGNDRVEWFLLLNGQISMEVRDRDTGILLAYLHMKPGDCTAMPADISHNLWAPERSMLLVWENGNPQLPELIRLGKTPTAPLEEFGLK